MEWMKLAVLIISSGLVGCSSIYVPPIGGSVAYADIPIIKSDYALLGGFSGEGIAFGEFDEDGCISNLSDVQVESLNEENLLPLRAGEYIAILAHGYQGNTSCLVPGAIKLEAGKLYSINFRMKYKSCALSVMESNPDGRNKKVVIEKVYNQFHKRCRKI
ncbi:60 kDa chaperonin 2-GroEL protein 2-Protein Cpn60 2 [Moritella viscosa]|uniref:hypothetical protein n=2 Tax=Moritella viscosa TaxID=80854 RepID=UPI000922C237|nr:hypothetical protein [Moritella viscosa]SGY85060.1 60 kDa chaperonin 2-GroEL protein 2-Protein Cpn60 2 [Moritella viscosa]SHN98448.1 60 kDa chaperonin 2-GroEL protein 2-Protein Cpn60 2 [Moritella viscosa]